MNTIVVHGSSLTSDTPRDIDVIHTGAFADAEVEMVRAWACGRGLPADLPIDAKRQDGSAVYVPQAGGTEAPYHVLAGDAPVRLVRYERDLPALVRAYDASVLTGILRGVHRPDPALPAAVHLGARLCIHDPRTEADAADWVGYTQGLQALRNAIWHCPSWSEVPAAAWISRLAEVGPSAATIAVLAPGSQAGAGDAVVCVVREDGLHSCYGDAFVPWAEVSTATTLP